MHRCRTPVKGLQNEKIVSKTGNVNSAKLLNNDPIGRPLDVRVAGVGGFGDAIGADVGIFIPARMPIRESDAGAAIMPGTEGGGVNLRLADVCFFLCISVERRFGKQCAAFGKHYKS